MLWLTHQASMQSMLWVIYYDLDRWSDWCSHSKALVHYQPRRIAMRKGYHGCQHSIAIYRRSRPEVEVIDIDADFQSGDLCWIETPINPYGVSTQVNLSLVLFNQTHVFNEKPGTSNFTLTRSALNSHWYLSHSLSMNTDSSSRRNSCSRLNFRSSPSPGSFQIWSWLVSF